MTSVDPRPLAALLLALLLAPPLAARDSDSEQPIEVEADSLELREQENISIYEGNVSLKQGSLEISSDRLVIRFNEAGDLLLMEMTATHFAVVIVELAQARFSHAGDTIEGSLIRINTDDNSIQAGNPKSDERVKMLITPRKKAGSSE